MARLDPGGWLTCQRHCHRRRGSDTSKPVSGLAFALQAPGPQCIRIADEAARRSVAADSTVRSSEEVTTMPQKEHLPSVSAKEQRMYEHIKASERKQGRSTDRAKSIAAATVVKHHNQEGHAKNK
jgi:hypothetical protein